MKNCSVENCSRAAKVRSLCSLHYQRSKRGADMTAKPHRRRAVAECTIHGCAREAEGRGLCSAHYQRSLKGTDLTAPVRKAKVASGEWGAWQPNADGYIVRRRRVNNRNEYQSEHRLVMERSLGRPLRKGENVHHVNGVRHDNRIENLELWVTHQPRGQRPEDLVQWAREILSTYGDMHPVVA